MAHPKRAHLVEQLVEQVTADQIVWDRRNDVHDTALRSLEAYEPADPYHLIIQDDAVVCDDLIAAADLINSLYPKQPISFYLGRLRPNPADVEKQYRAARDAGAPLLAMDGPLWGVANLYPTADIEDLLVEFAQSSLNGDDARVGSFYRRRRRRCLYTLPSLVNHRPIKEAPSLIVKGRGGNRQAHWYIGNRSALTIDWTGEVYEAPPPSSTLTFQHRVSGSKQITRTGSHLATSLSADSMWELL